MSKNKPFGIVFNLSLILFFIGLIGFLSYISFKLYQKTFYKKIIAIFTGILTILLMVIVVVGIIDIRMLIPSVSSKTLTEEEWIADIRFLDRTLKAHPGYNDSLGDIVSNFRYEMEKSKTFDAYEANKTAMQMVSAFKDGHSYVMPFQFYFKTRYLPIQVCEFVDGVYITDSKYGELVGGKIVSINNQKIEDLLKNIKSLIGADNSNYAKYQSALYIPSLDVLKMIDNTVLKTEANIKVILKGKEQTRKIKSVSALRWLFWSFTPTSDWRPVGHGVRNKNTVEKKSDTLIYFTFNKTGPEENLNAISNKIKHDVNSGKIKHLLIDMRNNTGGDNTTYNYLIKVLTEAKVNLTLFTSRKTFSAGLNFISELKLKRKFIIIGEASGAGHNHYGDAQMLLLPNSGLMFSMSTREWLFIPEIKENTIVPDREIKYKSYDYFNHFDPWMDKFSSERFL
ncbi:MAG: hypothetical protein KDC67_13140 [Ignavibacteriae bacterium]|nr:hypothetical protein [Ignavibacteriota bacterium]